jgi:Ca2+-binding EF-hand superfamily protein
MRKSVSTIATGLAVLTGMAVALGSAVAGESDRQCGFRHGGHRMSEKIRAFGERYDVNKDGKITQQEIDQNRAAWIAEFDTDKDPGLTLKEFEALWLKARHLRMVRAFQMFDRDGDGKVTLEEYQRPLAEVVEEHDRNGDGVLSKEDRPRHGPHRPRDTGHEHDDHRDGDSQGSRQNDG